MNLREPLVSLFNFNVAWPVVPDPAKKSNINDDYHLEWSHQDNLLHYKLT